MRRVLRLAHFDKNKKPKTLELSYDSPSTNDKGFTEEGSLLLSIQGDDHKAYFQLSVAEAALLKERLEYVLSLLSQEYIEAEAEKAKEKTKPAGKG